MNNDKTSPVIPVILSGGAGTRLWPLSRETAPKPFMPLPDGETLLAKTAHRAASLAGVTGLVTVTNRDYYFRTKDVYAGLGADEPRDAVYLLEPFGRNTAPAVALAALLVQSRHGSDAVMLVLAADHLIRNQKAFGDAVTIAAGLARDGRLVTFGITPAHPETGYGYIECGNAIADHAFAATRFVEKPPLERARLYLAAGNYVWNSGMFAFTAGTILATFARYAPAVLDALRPVWEQLAAKSGESALEIDAATFAATPNISIDYAVMERAAADGNVAVVRGDFDWSDVGSWQSISELYGGRRPRKPRQRRARRHRHARHVHPFRGPHRRHDRRRQPGHRRHARRRAGGAQGSPAAGQGRGRGTEGTRPRFLQAAQDHFAALGHVHGARGGTRASR